MQKLLLTLLPVLLLSFQIAAQADCNATERYVDYLFEAADLESTDVVFANFSADQLWNKGDTSASNVCFDPRNYLTPQSDGSWDMSMSVIYPKASVDNCTQRASIIFLHGGGYAHQAGNNTSTATIEAAGDLARRGYVVCAINYRKGWDIRDAKNSLGLGPLLPGCQNCPCENGNSNCDPYSFMKNTYTMLQDARAAHRKLLNQKSSFGIDENLVFYMGASTGAIGALHAAFASDDMPDYQDDDGVDLKTHLGNEDAIGESIMNGANFNIAGVTTLAGAIKDSDWIESSDNVPVMFNHTSLDEAVQYCSGTILNMKYFKGLVNKTEHLVLQGPGKLYKDIQCLDDPSSKTRAWLRTHKGLYHNFCAPLGSSDPSDNCDELSTLGLVLGLNAAFMKEVILGNEIINNHKITEQAHVSGPCNIVESDNETLCTNYVPCVPSGVIELASVQLSVYPNPLEYTGTILLPDENYQDVRLFLIDVNGSKINCNIKQEGNKIYFEKGNLLQGMYLFWVSEQGVFIGNGKLVIL